MTTAAPMETLTIETRDAGFARHVLTHCLQAGRSIAKKAKKKDEELGIDTTEHERFELEAKRLLGALGHREGNDPRQMDFTQDKNAADSTPAKGPRARVDCVGCKRQFAMETGREILAACPDCGAVHEVSSGDDGTLFRIRARPQMPTHIHELWVQSKDQKTHGKLNKIRRRALDEWISAHPDWIESPELVVRGDRVADPAVPGSGNPLRIDCATIAGTECSGFDSTDTPGEAVCAAGCGQKYTIELVEGRVNVRCWSLEDEIRTEEGEVAAVAADGIPADDLPTDDPD